MITIKKCIAALTLLLPTTAFAQSTFEEGGVMYMEDLSDPSKMAVIVAQNWNPATMSSKYSGDITIPATIEHDLDTYEVAGLGIGCFVGCPNLKSLTIDVPLKSLTTSVIFADNLTTLKLPDCIEELSSSINVKNAENIYFGKSLKKVNCCFMSADKLQELNLPSTVESISISFQNCPVLKQLNLTGGNLTELESSFGQVPMLESLSIAGKNLTIKFCFQNASNLKDVKLSGISTIKDSFNECNIDKLIIPEGITSITSSFDTFTGTELVLPNSLTELERSFYRCPNLKTIKLGKGVCNVKDFHKGNGETIYCPWDEVPKAPYFKYDANASVTFVVPIGMEAKYREAWADDLKYTNTERHEKVTFREEKF